MKFTLSWLKDHLDTTASADNIALALTKLGLEVESVSNPADALRAFTIAHVREAVPHPNADKLRVCTVDTGAEVIQVVCGAPNARTGMKAVLGRPGDYVPGLDVTLKEAEIRGVKSQGMMCSARELQLGEEHDGILDLPADAPIGTAYATWAGLDDPLFDIAITPNRQDCLGVRGIARDLAAAGLGSLKPKPFQAVGGSFVSPIKVHLAAPELCPVFAGRFIRGVKNGPSPDWLQRRLKAVGLRPISALVDITNLLSLDRARPLHVYDARTLTGNIYARRGRASESFEALDGKTYAVDERMCVIADDARVLGLGGIMGGMASGCTDATVDVFLESAWFDPASTGHTGRAVGIHSDARARFERGVDPASVIAGLEIATTLIIELCGGTPSEPVVAGAEPIADKIVAYRPARTASLGGLAVDEAQQRDILTRLGFSVSADWQVRVPSWRRDVDGEADLVEEVLRLNGYDAIPSVPLARGDGVAKPTATALQARTKRVRRAAAARGWAEAITWSFVAPAEAAPFGGGAWTLENPISADLAVMRPSLLPGLVRAAARNLDRGQASVRLFEAGKRYLADSERPTLALVGAGTKVAKHWQSGKAQSFDVFDAKAEALALLDAAGAPVDKLGVTADAPAWYHPGRSGVLRLGPQNPLAHFGELHPAVAKVLDIDGVVIVAELFLDALPAPKAAKRARPRYAPPSLMPLSRDFAFLVPLGTPAAQLLTAVKGADKSLIQAVSLFDVFTGAGVPEGQQSVAINVSLQPGDKSLTDADLDAFTAKVIEAAQKACGAVLRG
jgi:phenylalanyl-tRNA synthetase beta chain